MDINKALKNQNNSYKRFLIFMCFIFFALPAILITSHLLNMFFIIYLFIIEMLILICIVKRIDNETLIIKFINSRLNIYLGLFKEKIKIINDKIVVVHIDKTGKDMEIIVVCKSTLKYKRSKSIGLNFFKKYKIIGIEYPKIINDISKFNLYYFIINKGGLKKYILLDTLYRNCVNAYFTEEAVKVIKEYRQ